MPFLMTEPSRKTLGFVIRYVGPSSPSRPILLKVMNAVVLVSLSKGSAGEVESHLCIAFDLGYLDKSTFDRLSSATTETARLIGALMQYLRRSGIKGGKYK